MEHQYNYSMGLDQKETDLEVIKRRNYENTFIEEQAENIQSLGVQNIITKYGTDDIDKIDRLWFSVLRKMIDNYMIK